MNDFPIKERLIYFSVMLALLVTTISCKKSVPEGNVDGIVLYTGTTIPVEGVSIDIDGAKALSSQDGSYSIAGIPAGSHTLKADKVGFISFSKEISVSEGSNMVIIQMLSPVFTSSVGGILTGDFTGDPQAGMTVLLLNPDGTESEIRGTSDGNGLYQLQNVPFGNRTIIVRSAGTEVYRSEIVLTNTDFQLDIDIPEPMVFTDSRDGNVYNARKIGDHIWFTENLAYLPIVCPSDWESDDQALYYVYDYQGTDPAQAMASENYSVYGVLYNWTAASSACPDGWHLPDDSEWKNLEIYLGMEPEDADLLKWRATGAVGSKLKSDSGWDSDGNGNNISGFGALPGGVRNTDGTFSGIGLRCNFWTSGLNALSMPLNRFLSYDNDGVSRYGFMPALGFSVRCVKDKQ